MKNLIVWEHSCYAPTIGITAVTNMIANSTAVACIELNRNFIGYELDEYFFDVAQKRITEAIARREQSLFKLA